MNDEQLIWENYKSILTEAKIQIKYYDDQDSGDDYDPWEIADKVEAIFKRANIRPSMDKKISFFAMVGEEVIGATYSSTSMYNAEDFVGPEGEEVFVYEFDIAVDPNHQGGTVGYLLTKACVGDAISCEAKIMYNRVINPKMAQMLERLFKFDYLHEDNPEKKNGYSSIMIKYL